MLYNLSKPFEKLFKTETKLLTVEVTFVCISIACASWHGFCIECCVYCVCSFHFRLCGV
ncbi:hypothetical protein BRADI_2g15152v3 [Brachypodium distachyon]|uniref:Uncharacterized protein n=1 Tax=Brachypodium distachyon TaxID=15368 RepID=A0A2K2D8Q8_BRADI|nr:hypothetical protein BRADI_2g15152v3 [Brachypodium distachyon]